MKLLASLDRKDRQMLLAIVGVVVVLLILLAVFTPGKIRTAIVSPPATSPDNTEPKPPLLSFNKAGIPSSAGNGR